MRRLFFLPLAFALISMALSDGQAHAATAGAPAVAARVGDEVITVADLNEYLLRYVPKGGYHGLAADIRIREKYRGEALNEMIEVELLHKEAQKRKVAVAEETVQNVIEANEKRFKSKKGFEAALKKQGWTPESFRRRVVKQYMVIALINGLFDSSAVTEEELKSYYEQNKESFRRPDSLRLFHILVKTEPNDPDDVLAARRKAAEELLARIRGGEDFGTVAYKHSEDEFRVKSGEMGMVHRGQVTPDELQEAAFALSEGEVSDVVRTIYGFHILKVTDKKPAETLPFEEVRERLRKTLQEKRFEEAKKKLLEDLRKEFPVKILITLESEDATKPAPAGH